MDRVSAIADLLRQASAEGTKPGAPTDRAKVARLAEEFEAMLMLQMLRQMRSSMLDEPEGEEGLGLDTFTDTFDGELARHLSRAGGLGLKEVLLRGFEKQGLIEGAPGVRATGDVGAPTLPKPGTAAAGAAVAALAAVSAVSVPGTSRATGESAVSLVESKVTSAFGQRRDPFHGQTRFHAGVDLRAAYGQQVPAVSEGTVLVAGEQGGYGLTVVVDHGRGLTTRYAHLSGIDVQAGEELAAGQILGRVGQTGRATAPHLHFEVFHQGHAVDPERAAERFEAAGLKLVALDVD